MKPAAGARLAGRYEVRALVADRPTGELYRGYDEQIGVDVALRFVDDELLTDDAERQRFVSRARRSKSLQHPNILRLYDVVLDGDVVFLVLQWAPGERLTRRLAREPLTLEDTRVIIRRVAAGVAHAHQHGVVLGNVSADTVMLYPDGVKLSNVGIGPALPRDRFVAAMAARQALDDLAPEVVAGGALDERADVYAVARLASTMLGEVSPAVQDVLARGLGDAVMRPRDVEAFVRDLDAAIAGRELERGLPIVPTGSDTERVPRLPPAPLDGGDTRPDADGPKKDVTNVLDTSDLIEVPEVTELGHRRPPSGKSAQPAAPSPVASLQTFAPVDPDREDDEATRPHERLPARMPDIEIVRGMVAERLPDPPTLPPPEGPHPHAMWLPLMLSLALVLSIVGTMYAIRVSQPKTVVVTQAPPATPPTPKAPTVTALPRTGSVPVMATPAPGTPPAVTPAQPAPQAGECPLGMAPLSVPHPFCIDQYEYPGGHTIPRTHVSLDDAKRICESREARLCTDAEWEQACRGPAQGSYPYGSSFDPNRCNTGGKQEATVLEAGAMPRCRSAAGAFDMSGNVAEWTASGTQRGGSALQASANGRCSHVVRGTDPAGADDVGFRCCRDL